MNVISLFGSLCRRNYMFINYSLITFAQRSTILQLVYVHTCVHACVHTCARRVEANCVTGYVSLAKLDCLKSSKRESTPCRLYVGETFPIPRRTIFFSSSSSSSASSSFMHVSREYPRENCIESSSLARAACLLARDSSNQWIFSEKYSCTAPVKGFPAGVTMFPLFSVSFPLQSACGRARNHDFYSQRVCTNNF